MGIQGTPQDHLFKLLSSPPPTSMSGHNPPSSHKRKLDSPDPSPPPKHPRLDLPSPRRFLHHHHHHHHLHHLHQSATNLPAAPPPPDQLDQPDHHHHHQPDHHQPDHQLAEEDVPELESTARRVLPLSISTIESAHGQEEDGPGTQGLSVYAKGFFYVKGNDLRAGYWVYYRGHCVAKALVWNNEFNEIRYDHQGYGPCMAAMNKSNVSPVTIGLMALLDAIAWGRSVLAYAHWHVYGDNVDALKLVDMYQRNSQFMKFHAERHLLDAIVNVAQSGNIHLHRR